MKIRYFVVAIALAALAAACGSHPTSSSSVRPDATVASDSVITERGGGTIGTGN
jgi:hypothetical protein